MGWLENLVRMQDKYMVKLLSTERPGGKRRRGRRRRRSDSTM
jgi:hypothetical protein